ncbi:MAG TPA: SDR family oxidoreductase [Phototrophicaceae bacterium]|nr:SDR family oxidoreductase [Phototrophicaceae bacterium]
MQRTAVVIGAGQGMGKAIALKLARNDIHVYLVGRTPAKLEAVGAQIAAEGGRYSIFAADVSQDGALDGLKPEFEHGLDILVNCAGEALMNSFDETTFEDWQRIIAENMTTSFVATSTLLPDLRKSDNASILLLSSKVALKAASVVAYAAAKSGLLGFARSLSLVLREEGIRVVALCPGATDTPMRWAATPEMNHDLTIDAGSVAETAWFIVNLPRGTTTGEILIQAELYQ